VERFRIEDFTAETALSICSKYIASTSLKDHKCPSLSSFQAAPLVVNHAHTVHAPQSYVTWSSLYYLDEEHTTMAQKMALRYGYLIKKHDLLKDTKDDSIRERYI
jgi:hypothetical protein